MFVYTLTEEDFQKTINQVKEHTIEMLVNEKFLTKKQAAEICSNYTIIVHKKGILGEFIDKILFKNFDFKKGEYRFTFAKIVIDSENKVNVKEK